MERKIHLGKNQIWPIITKSGYHPTLLINN
jgi:hypothetical protein